MRSPREKFWSEIRCELYEPLLKTTWTRDGWVGL